jgi:hypothetical protein
MSDPVPSNENRAAAPAESPPPLPDNEKPAKTKTEGPKDVFVWLRKALPVIGDDALNARKDTLKTQRDALDTDTAEAAIERERGKRLHRLMYSLIYPAVLGTGLVTLFSRLLQGIINGANPAWYAPALVLSFLSVIIFLISFTRSSGLKYPNLDYRLWIFIFDLYEAFAMAVVFGLLGYLNIAAHQPKYTEGPLFAVASLTLAIYAATSYPWRPLRYAERETFLVTVVRILFVGTALIPIYRVLYEKPREETDLIVSGGLLVLTVAFYFFRSQEKNPVDAAPKFQE